ncbi:beta strand repeat-containing protein [Flavobacterium anhuiense]|uniref:beta strand repeat-containing protein n=1 Tax=Flavobacterium anhuiense TaxID=459526 RepID=UPI0020267F2F|nr:hypothetical protein [Flavobacterium anhuiense]URM37131.1 hypothetical protein LLY39_00630 [Flavobacterium anhuiense]
MTTTVNGMINNAKQIDGLPPQTVLNPNSLLHVSLYGVSQKIAVQQIISDVLNFKFNRLISIAGPITVSGNNITIPAAVWVMENVNYQTFVNTVVNTPYAATGYTRTDIFVGNKSNQIIRITGPETAGVSPAPNVPVDTVYITTVNVTDSSIGNPTEPVIGDINWGDIKGTLANQSDLKTALDEKLSSTVNLTAGRIPYTSGPKVLTDSSRLLWNNTTSNLNLNGNKPILTLKENLNNRSIDISTAGSGSGILIFQDGLGKRLLTLEGAHQGSNIQSKLGIGQFTGGIPQESQLYVYGGTNGANIDARGSAEVDEANIDLEGNDWEDGVPNSLGFSYFGSKRTGITTIYGYARTKLGQVRFGNTDTALITSINDLGNVTPIRFGINTAEVANINDKGFAYKSDFSSGNISNPRWLVDKGYVDGLVVGLLDDRGSYNASSNVFPSTGGSGISGAILKGDLWYVSVAGTLGGRPVAVGDSFRALVDAPGQTAGNWSLLSSNLGYVPANDASVLHRTGDESFTGLKSANQFGGSLNLTVTGGSGAALSVNTTAANGALAVGSTSSGNAVTVNSYSTGDAIIANIGASGTGYNFVGKNNLANTFTVNKIGDVTGNKFVKTGGTASQYLMADGSTSTLTNPVTGTGTLNYIPIFTATGTISNSAILQGANGSIGINGASAPDTGDTRIQSNGTTYSTLSLKSTNIDGIIRAHNPNGLLYLGTISNHGVGILANGNETVRFTTNGNVGIGTTNPTAKVTLSGLNEGAALDIFNTSSNLNFRIGTGNVGGALFFENNAGSEVARLQQNGNVGIGTLNPVSRLHISSSAGTTYPTLGTQYGHFFMAGDDGKYGLMGGIHTTTGAAWFQAMRNDAATAYNLLLQPVGGNVGIGTTNPVGRFQVKVDTDQNLSVTSSNSKVTIAGVNDNSTFYSPLGIDADSIDFNIRNVNKMQITSSGDLVITARIFANDAAADADTTLPSGGLYRVTGSRTAFIKP